MIFKSFDDDNDNNYNDSITSTTLLTVNSDVNLYVTNDIYPQYLDADYHFIIKELKVTLSTTTITITITIKGGNRHSTVYFKLLKSKVNQTLNNKTIATTTITINLIIHDGVYDEATR